MGNLIFKYFFVLLVFLNPVSSFAQTVIPLSKPKAFKGVNLYGARITGVGGTILITNGDNLYAIGKKNSKVRQYDFLRGIVNTSTNIATNFGKIIGLEQSNNLLLFNSMEIGINHIYLADYNSKRLLNAIHHPHIRFFEITPDSEIIISGLHFTKYYEYLRKYDTNDFSRRKETDKAFNHLYSNYSGYYLAKYNTDLELIDSTMFVRTDAATAEAIDYLSTYVSPPIEIFDNQILTINPIENNRIEFYTSQFEKVKTLEVDFPEFKGFPRHLTEDKVNRMFNIPGSFSYWQGVIAFGDTIIAVFSHFKEKKQCQYSMFLSNGKKLADGIVPGEIIRLDSQLYLLNSSTVQRPVLKDITNFYLVPISVSELVEGAVTKDYVRRLING